MENLSPISKLVNSTSMEVSPPVQMKDVRSNQERPHECSLCTLRFKTKGNLNEHINFYHMKGSVPCSECDRVFPTSRDLRFHRIEHSVLKGRCPHCRSHIVIDNVNAGSFNRAYTEHIVYCARKPSKRADSRVTSEVIKNINWENPDNVDFQCQDCLLIFPKKVLLKNHNCNAEIESCTVAISSVMGNATLLHNSDSNFEDELSNISDANKFTSYPSSFCIVCNLEFENEDYLSQHLYDDHQNIEVNTTPEMPTSLPAPNVLYCYQSPKVAGEGPAIDVKDFNCTFCHQSFQVEEEMLEHSERCIFSPQESLIEDGKPIAPNASSKNDDYDDVKSNKGGMSSVDEDGKSSVGKDGKGPVAEDGKGSVAEDGKVSADEVGKGSADEDGKGPVVEDGKGSADEDGKGSVVEDGKGSVVEDGKGSVVEDGKGSVVEDGKGSVVEDGKGSVVEDGKGSVVEDGKGSVVEDGKGSVVEDGKGSHVDKKAMSPVDKNAMNPVDKNTKRPVDEEGKSSVDDKGKSSVDDKGKSSIDETGKSSVVEDGKGSVVEDGKGSVVEDGKGSVDEDGKGSVVEDGKGSVDEDGKSSVDEDGKSSVDEDGKSSVDEDGKSSIEENEMSSVEEDEMSSVEEDDLSSVDDDDKSSIDDDDKSSVDDDEKSSADEDAESSVDGEEGSNQYSSIDEVAKNFIDEDGNVSVDGEGKNFIDDGKDGETSAKGDEVKNTTDDEENNEKVVKDHPETSYDDISEESTQSERNIYEPNQVSPSNLDDNEDTSTGILVRYLCQYCKKTFGDPSEMKKHKRVCLSREPGVSFSQLNENEVRNLVTAEMQDDNTDVFIRWRCKYCKEEFDEKSCMEKHKPNCRKREDRRKSRSNAVFSDAESHQSISSDVETSRKTINDGNASENEANIDLYPEMPLISRMTYPCEFCLVPFEEEDGRNNHQKLCVKAKPRLQFLPLSKLKCPSCPLTFKTEHLNLQHQLNCPKTKKRISSFFAFCKLCQVSFTDFDVYKTHKNDCVVPNEKKEEPKVYKCPNCKDNFHDFDKFRAHSWNCLYPDKAQCGKCATLDKSKSNCLDCKEIREKKDNSQNKLILGSSPPLKKPQTISKDVSVLDKEKSTKCSNDDKSTNEGDIDKDSMLTVCFKCEKKFDSLDLLRSHASECPVPSSSTESRNLPVLRCPTCKVFFRGTETLVAHKCRSDLVKNPSRKRPKDNWSEDDSTSLKRISLTGGDSEPRCHKCEALCHETPDLRMVVITSGEVVKYACLKCYTKPEVTNRDLKKKTTTPKVLMDDKTGKSLQGEITCTPQSSTQNEETVQKPIMKPISNRARKSTPYSASLNWNRNTRISTKKFTRPSYIKLVRLPDCFSPTKQAPVNVNSARLVREIKERTKFLLSNKNQPLSEKSTKPQTKEPARSLLKANATTSPKRIVKLSNPNAVTKKLIIAKPSKVLSPSITKQSMVQSNNQIHGQTESIFSQSKMFPTYSRTPVTPPNVTRLTPPNTTRPTPPNVTRPNYSSPSIPISTPNPTFARPSITQTLSNFNPIFPLISASSFVPQPMTTCTYGPRQSPMFHPGFMTIVPLGPVQSTSSGPPRMGNIRHNVGSSGFLSLVDPSGTHQAAGRPVTPGSKPMPPLILGNPRMMLRQDGVQSQPNENPNNNNNDGQTGRGTGNDASSNKENKKRLPLSSVLDCDGWILEGVLKENGNDVEVKKCICGNCYRSLANEEALKQHAWTEHKRLIEDELYLNKIENVSQDVREKALVFARFCSLRDK